MSGAKRYPPPQNPGPLSYARVALHRPLPHPYTYYIPEAMSDRLRVGSLVRVPLRNEEAEGVVVDIASEPGTRAPIKPIARHLTPEYAISPALIELGHWMADYYFCALGEALAAISMIGLADLSPRTETLYELADPAHWLTAARDKGPDGARTTAAHQRVVAMLLAVGNQPALPSALREAAGVGDGVLKTMLTHGWLARVEREASESSNSGPPNSNGNAELETWNSELETPFSLTPAQREAYAPLEAALHARQYRACLLHGVTGSGKTEIYLRLIEESLRIGRSAVVLVPEIALTPQIVDTFRRRLGPIVGVYHSKLTRGEKFALWRRIERRESRVVIGARSALFSPLPELGVIIVDEEHEPSYKQGDTPRYHARDVAIVRASREGAVAVLGSATPSIESLHNAREGKYLRLRLPERIGPHASPLMTVVDMKRHIGAEAEKSGAHLVSPPLRAAIERRLAAGEQVILLLNRRGFANHVLCLRCEKSVLCPRCDVPMTYHKVGDRMLCHWCGHKAPVPAVCPHCNEGEIHKLGLGTQRIEETLAELFPGARTIRVDMDSMRRRGAYDEAWRKITRHEVDLILGTQMIAKGLHLERVTLVGVISADFALFLPDFRAPERTYQLLTQVAGRAGRGAVAGEVIVQTFLPHHYAIDMAARLAEEEFYERELHVRQMLRFPPFARLAAILVAGPDLEAVRDHAERLSNFMKKRVYLPDFKTVQVLGPTPAPIARIEDQHRWRILGRCPRVRPLHDLLRDALAEYSKLPGRGKVNVTIDIDPVDLM